MGAIHCPVFAEVIGPDIITDGTCDVPASWTLTADWTISGGKANYTPGSELTLQQTITWTYATAGIYRLTFDIVSGTGALLPALTGDAGGASGTVRSGAGTHTEDITYSGNLTGIRFTPSFGTAAVSIDNIILRKLY